MQRAIADLPCRGIHSLEAKHAQYPPFSPWTRYAASFWDIWRGNGIAFALNLPQNHISLSRRINSMWTSNSPPRQSFAMAIIVLDHRPIRTISDVWLAQQVGFGVSRSSFVMREAANAFLSMSTFDSQLKKKCVKAPFLQRYYNITDSVCLP